MSGFALLRTASLKTRMIIAVCITVLCMSVVVYIWYASFTTSLSGSFEVEGEYAHSGIPTSGFSERNDESFFTSLKNIVLDIDFGTERFAELRASFINIFSQ